VIKTQTLTTAPTLRNPSPKLVHYLGLFINIFTGAVILYFATHPSFYYMTWVVCLQAQILLAALSYIAFLIICFTGNRLSRTQFQRLHRQWQFSFIGLILIGFAVAVQLPLRVAFLFIKPALEQAISAPGILTNGIPNNIIGPLHTISAENTNARLERNRSGNYNVGRIMFVFEDDVESAFIYSPQGIKTLTYNSGSCGHLIGPWYWMKED
jgi:hypothetical protein